jgi:hypothetical protein
MAELSLWLDSYDDLYSDFDSRNYIKRRISQDFIDELRASFTYREEKIDALILLLPHSKRDPNIEAAIAANLKEQVRKRIDMLTADAKRAYGRGIKLLIAGIVVMALSTFTLYRSFQSYWITLARVIFEPSSWFMIWNALEYLFYDYKDILKKIEFYQTFELIKIHFKDE